MRRSTEGRLGRCADNHYRAQLVFLPAFGLGQWLLMSGTVHGLLRLTGQALFGIGLHARLDVPWRRAVVAALTASTVYVLGASRFVR